MKRTWPIVRAATLGLLLSLPTPAARAAWKSNSSSSEETAADRRKLAKDDTDWDVVGAALAGSIGLTLLGLQVGYKQARRAARQRKLLEQTDQFEDATCVPY